jgi:MATE family multidrug resistance protein
MVGALNGFFSGRGQTKVITWLTLVANLINLVLDPVLIFGWGSIPSMGIAGACLATWIGLAVQVSLLFYLFIRRESREKYETGNCAIRWDVMWSCVRVGGPEAVGAVLELSAWGALYILLGNLSAIHILVASVGQSLFMAVFWFGIGIENGAASVAGNMLGKGNLSEVRRCFHSGIKIIGIFTVVLFAFLIVGKDWIVDLFLQQTETLEMEGSLASLSQGQILEARNYLMQSLFVLGAYVTLENIRCLIYGILRAAGDTLFILFLSVVATWSLLILPTYQLFTVMEMDVDVCFWIWLGYAFVTTAISYLRFTKGNWNKGVLFGDITG